MSNLRSELTNYFTPGQCMYLSQMPPQFIATSSLLKSIKAFTCIKSHHHPETELTYLLEMPILHSTISLIKINAFACIKVINTQKRSFPLNTLPYQVHRKALSKQTFNSKFPKAIEHELRLKPIPTKQVSFKQKEHNCSTFQMPIKH